MEDKEYYCNICKRDISEVVFRYSLNKYKKPLCFEHQKSFVNSTTMDLINLVKKRHEKELTKDKELVSIDDWIKADFNQWKSELDNKQKVSYNIKINDDEKLDKKKR